MQQTISLRTVWLPDDTLKTPADLKGFEDIVKEMTSLLPAPVRSVAYCTVRVEGGTFITITLIADTIP